MKKGCLFLVFTIQLIFVWPVWSQPLNTNSSFVGASGGIQNSVSSRAWFTVGEKMVVRQSDMSSNMRIGFYPVPIPSQPLPSMDFLSPDSVKLRWHPVVGAYYYVIYRKDDPYSAVDVDTIYVFAPDSSQTFPLSSSPNGYRFFKVKSGD